MNITHKQKMIVFGVSALILVGLLGFAVTRPSDVQSEAEVQDSTTVDATAQDSVEEGDLPDVSALELSVTLSAEASLAMELGEVANLNASATAEGLPEGAQIVFAYVVSNDSILVDEAGNVTALAVSTVKPFVTITAQYDADGDGVADSAASLATKKVQVLVS